MLVRMAVTAAIAAGATIAPLTVSAQQAPPQPPPEVQQWMMEAQQLQMQLQSVQEQALEDESLQAEQEKIGQMVRAAIIEVDPENEQRLARYEAIVQEAQAAQASNDTEKLAALTTEAQALQPHIAQAQEQALQKPEIEESIATFEKNLQDRMAQIDPESRAQLERLQELDTRIRTAMGGGA